MLYEYIHLDLALEIFLSQSARSFAAARGLRFNSRYLYAILFTCHLQNFKLLVAESNFGKSTDTTLSIFLFVFIVF